MPRCWQVGAGFGVEATGAHFSVGTTAISDWHTLPPSCREAAKLPSQRTYYSNLEDTDWGVGGGVSSALTAMFAVTMYA